MGIVIWNNEKIFLLLSRIWASIILIWAIARICISTMNYALPTFDEYHLSNQFGIYGISLSVVM
ncbi:MAG: hypothetical protein AAGA10_26075, partial [Bacteroidota bacterium]